MIKKLHGLIAIISFLLWQHVSAQHLLSDTLLLHIPQSQMAQTLQLFGLPAPATGVNCYRLIYSTLNAQQTDTTIASGLLVVPDTVTCALAVAMYDHGTTLQRYEVPGYLSAEATIVEIMAEGGYCALAPDYLGLGASPGFHPYVHARSEAQAGIDLIFAAKTFAANNHIPLTEQLFLTGYSQGGHACMATHKAIQENYAGQLTVTASAPGSGPYNLSGIQSAGLADDSFYADPAYIPYLIFAYQSVYGNLYDSVQQFLLPPYDTLLPPLYFAETLSTTSIDSLLPNHIDSIVVAGQLQQFVNDSTTDPLRLDLDSNDVYAWKPNAPVLMAYCTADEQVNYQNTIFTYNYFINEGDTFARDTDGGALDHGDCLFPALKGAFAFFQSLHIYENNLVLALSADSESTPGAHNASVQVSVSGGTGYTIAWNIVGADSTDSIVTGLSNGTYTVTVTDSSGCAKVRSISTTQGITGIAALNQPFAQLQVFPNPSSGLLNLKVTGFIPETSALYDVNGQKIMGGRYTPQIDVSNICSGIYLAEIKGRDVTVRTRFVKL